MVILFERRMRLARNALDVLVVEVCSLAAGTWQGSYEWGDTRYVSSSSHPDIIAVDRRLMVDL